MSDSKPAIEAARLFAENEDMENYPYDAMADFAIQFAADKHSDLTVQLAYESGHKAGAADREAEIRRGGVA